MLFDNRTKEAVETLLTRIKPADSADVVAQHLAVSTEDAEELLGILKTRKNNDKFPSIKYAQPDDLRFGTHNEVASWRAQRLACDTLIEGGAGVGMQTVEFAKTCKQVVAVEIDKRKVAYAQANVAAAGLDNVEFVQGDAIELRAKMPKADIVFLDPQRPAESEVRDIHVDFSPPLATFIDDYSTITPSIAIELPPHIRSLDVEGEREYISVDGALRRLTIYLGPLMKSPRSALILPGGATVAGAPTTLPAAGALKTYLYELNEAVVRAELVPLIMQEGMDLAHHAKHTLLTSDKRATNPFFRNSFEVVATCDNNEEVIKEHLARANAKHVVLRMEVDLHKYWQQRKRVEDGLAGTDTIHLFLINNKAVLAKKLKS